MSLVELARFSTGIEAEIIRTLLESHGIPAHVFDGGLNSAEGGGMASAARVMVLDEDRDEAATIVSGSQAD